MISCKSILLATPESLKMDLIFWMGLGIGAGLSLLASILANILHNKIVAVLESRKLAAQSSRYLKALSFHKLISELNSGVRDKHIFMNQMLCQLSLFGAASIIFLATNFTILAIADAPEELSLSQLVKQPTVTMLTVLFSSIFCIYSYIVEFSRYSAIVGALENFERFDADFRAKWSKAKSVIAAS
jgi:hypothetical protein